MTREETDAFLAKEYVEAVRYMDNAKDALKKAIKEEHGYYKDRKYVKYACGIAYRGVLTALDAWLTAKGVPEIASKKSKSIDFYRRNIAQLDDKRLAHLDTVYSVLQFLGYYRGEMNVNVIDTGFEVAYEIIDRIKPENPDAIAAAKEAKETRAAKAKRMWNKMMLALGVLFG